MIWAIIMAGLQLSFDPNDKQLVACERWNDTTTVEIVYGGAKYGGKSYLGASLIFGDALIYPETSYFIARKELNDLRKYTLPTIYEVFTDWGLRIDVYASYNGQDNFFECYNGSRVYLIDCKKTPQDPLFERFGSMQMTRGWIEEGGEVEFAAKENLKLSLGRKNNDTYKLPPKLLITCNPKKNWIYTDFYKPFIGRSLPPDRALIQALPDDNIHGNPEYIKGLKNTKDKTIRERLVLGNWEYDDDPNALIPYESILAIFTNDHVPAAGNKFITADVARMGDDKSVIRVWHGLRVIERVVMEKTKVTQTAERIRAIAYKHGIPMMRVLADEDGVGGGVVDILNCKGFLAGSSPVNPKPGENYRNLKSQCCYKLAEMVDQALIYENMVNEEDRQLLIEDLEQIKKVSNDETKLEVAGKKEVKAILQRSPDDGDTYVMRMFFELKVEGFKVVKPAGSTGVAANGRSNYNM
jgi:phage terminase large subunit